MPSYLSPGVYVEEIPSAVQAIAGVGTSTAGFIGILANTTFTVPRPNPYRNASIADETALIQVKVRGEPAADPADPETLFGVAAALAESLVGATPAAGPPMLDFETAQTVVNDALVAGDTDVTIQNTKSFSPAVTIKPGNIEQAKLCTNFGDFRKFFGNFSTDQAQSRLAHAVFGFFRNGGTRCYVGVTGSTGQLGRVLERFAAVDEIALVAAPGLSDAVFTNEIGTVRDALVTHCQIATQDRMAIFDSPEVVETGNELDTTLLAPSNNDNVLPDNSDYAAFYFPWIQVFDPATKIQNPVPEETGRIFVPPSGHMAGIYARVDTNRGVHKAPANEYVAGALGLKYNISKSLQDGLNPQGVNCIRDLNGNILVWGARTIGGDANGEWRYINVRRTFLFLRESIDEGTQWAVFEPNDEQLWAKITRNITAFLTTVWRSGALFGSTPEQAFYVKCDAETNPPELREVGQVVTEIGVAVVRPAEFVIFRISQWQPEP